MSLAVVVDHLTERLSDALGPGTSVGDAEPDGADLPAVTLTLDEATTRLAGIGRLPGGTREGALEVTISVDLADPVLDLGGGESVRLVPADRRSLVLPHGPIVRADGTRDLPFAAGDLVVEDDGGAWAVSAADPAGREVAPDVDAGILLFGEPLPASGTLRVTTFIGLWDATVSRFQGRLDVRMTAERAALGELTRGVTDALAAPDEALRLAPRSWGSAARPADAALPDVARAQELTYLFDAEIEQPVLTSGGGVIADVAVTLRAAENGQTRTETFDIVRHPSGGPA